MKPPQIWDPGLLLSDCLAAGIAVLRERENRYEDVSVEPLYIGNPAELVGVVLKDHYAGSDILVTWSDMYEVMRDAVGRARFAPS